MRLAAQTKLGFYPAAPEAISAILKHLAMPFQTDDVQILDPCCGEGLALRQLADGLGIPMDRVYAIELDGGRADAARKNLPGAHVLGPCSFMGARISAQSFGLVYCNPPFDDELGGGKRQEFTFAEKATRVLKVGGVLVLVMPTTAIEYRRDFQAFLASNYEDCGFFEFPPEVRKFREVVFFGRRRKKEVPPEEATFFDEIRLGGWPRDRDPIVGTHLDPKWLWRPCNAWAPHLWEKIELTDEELAEAVDSTRLVELLDAPRERPVPRPPLPLYRGHVALLLASGKLDGLVEPPAEPPHVVRGTARKVNVLADKTTNTDEDTGVTTDKEVWTQKIVLTVRAIGPDGTIHTFEDTEAKADSGNAVAGKDES